MAVDMVFSRLAISLALCLAPAHLPGQAAFDVVQKYCLACHSTAKHTGDLDLERFASPSEVLKYPKVWQSVIEQVTLGEMPPKAMPQPTPAERTRLLTWVRGTLVQAAQARAGDPGPVVLRRLNNAEYTFTIRDLTGVPTLDPAKEFPADGAAGEGFTNTGNSLAMSPALVSKYLDAAKGIAAHAVLLPNGIRFSPLPSPRDWTNETLAEIRAFYQQFTEAGGKDTVTQQGMALDKDRGGTLPLKRYLAASLGQQPVDAAGLSPRYLTTLTKALRSSTPSPLLQPLRRRTDVAALADEIEQWQQTLWKFSSVGHIGKVDGPKAWMEPVSPIASRQEFKLKLPAPQQGNQIKLYLAAHEAGDGSAGDSVIWKEPRLTFPGRPPIRLRDVRALVGALTLRRQEVFSTTAAKLNAEAERDHANDLPTAIQPLTNKIQKVGTFDFIQGWGGGKLPSVLANSTAQHVRIPGNMKPHAVALLPSATHAAAIGWRSPLAAPVRIEGTLTPAHPECGNGVAWSLELRRGNTRQRLAEGIARGAAAVPIGPLTGIAVLPGDLVSVVLDPREGNASCDLADLELNLAAPHQKWSLTADVSGSILAANPHGPWQFYAEPTGVNGSIPTGSLLARWQVAERPEAKRQLAAALQTLLTSAPPPANTPDGALFRQLTSLASPLLAGLDLSGPVAPSPWGLDPARFDGADLRVQAPSVIEILLPAGLVADGEFSVTGQLDPTAGAEGSVQLQLLSTPPETRSGLRPSGTSVRTTDGTWTSNNQSVSFGMPVIVHENSAARRRVEAAFDEFRQLFPASLCYSKIVPVDEVVTLTLFHREDQHLSRLLLTPAQTAHLDRLWDQLFFVSRAPLLQVDVFDQLWQYATQDADPSKFEPLRQPILDRAAAFRRHLVAAEPKHLDAVIDFANRAYRRPITAAETTELRALYTRLRQQDLPHDDALRLTLARVLVGPAFLYRTEKAPPGATQAPVSDAELSGRLSYFLWSSQPDPELRAAASAGKLRTAEGLTAQVRRMLRDPRVRRLATEFGTSWLHIRDFDSLDEKSERHFPTFRALRGDMYEESIQFFTDFFSANRPVASLLNADHTFLNGPLAQHYGIEGVTGPAWRRVDGMTARGRGGVLGLSSTLAKQSGASRTSPILRGNWVAEVLLGDKLPRPPKDVPQLPEDEANLTLTMRELTEKHTADPRCATCHKRIDPYGYALEQFDAIGRSRSSDLGGRPIQTKTKVMDGTEIEGLPGLRQYLLTNGRPAFVHQFSRKLLGYALGRAVQLSDEPLLTQLGDGSQPVGAIIEKIVTSRQFREIRGRDAAPEE